jgi:hypothetical protein
VAERLARPCADLSMECLGSDGGGRDGPSPRSLQPGPRTREVREGELDARLAILNDALRGREYLLGDAFTMGDVNMVSTLLEPWKVSKPDGEIDPRDARFPALGAWLTRCMARPAWGASRPSRISRSPRSSRSAAMRSVEPRVEGEAELLQAREALAKVLAPEQSLRGPGVRDADVRAGHPADEHRGPPDCGEIAA